MKNRKVLWIYAALAIGCALWFAGCDAAMEMLGFGRAEEKGQNLPGGENGETPSPGGMDDQSPLEGGGDENSPVINDDFDPTILSFYVSSAGDDANDGLSEEEPFKTLAHAYEAALGHADHKRVVVLSNLIEEGLVTLNSWGKPKQGSEVILIEGKYVGVKIERSVGADDSVLKIAGAKVHFRNILINGKIANSDAANMNNRALFIAGSSTEVTLGNGTVVTGKLYNGVNKYQNDPHGSGIRVESSAKLVMKNGSAVVNCEGIAYCRGTIMLYYHGVVEMEEGALVSGNTCYYGGGIALYTGTVTMSGGEISGNTAMSGGGVYFGNDTDNVFTMSGGVIYGNEEGLDSNLRNTLSEPDTTTVGPGGAAFRRMSTAGTATMQSPSDQKPTDIGSAINNTIDLRS
jgi:hypothetical protein